MDFGDPTAAELALDDLHVSVDHLLKLVEDRALGSLDDTGLVGFLQGFERLRNRLPLIDHQMITEGTTRNLAQNLCQGTMTRVLTSALHISAGEAAGRVRAAETLAGRTGRVQRLVLESRCSRPPPITRPAQDDRHQTDRTGAEGVAMGMWSTVG